MLASSIVHICVFLVSFGIINRYCMRVQEIWKCIYPRVSLSSLFNLRSIAYVIVMTIVISLILEYDHKYMLVGSKSECNSDICDFILKPRGFSRQSYRFFDRKTSEAIGTHHLHVVFKYPRRRSNGIKICLQAVFTHMCVLGFSIKFN
jgi:hypothetical protein